LDGTNLSKITCRENQMTKNYTFLKKNAKSYFGWGPPSLGLPSLKSTGLIQEKSWKSSESNPDVPSLIGTVLSVKSRIEIF